MNVYLEKLFNEYDLSHKDRYEIRQIYQVLPIHKRQKLIENFENIVVNINTLRKDIWLQQEVLLWETLWNIEDKITSIHKKVIVEATSDTLSRFRKQI